MSRSAAAVSDASSALAAVAAIVYARGGDRIATTRGTAAERKLTALSSAATRGRAVESSRDTTSFSRTTGARKGLLTSCARSARLTRLFSHRGRRVRRRRDARHGALGEGSRSIIRTLQHERRRRQDLSRGSKARQRMARPDADALQRHLAADRKATSRPSSRSASTPHPRARRAACGPRAAGRRLRRWRATRDPDALHGRGRRPALSTRSCAGSDPAQARSRSSTPFSRSIA